MPVSIAANTILLFISFPWRFLFLTSSWGWLQVARNSDIPNHCTWLKWATKPEPVTGTLQYLYLAEITWSLCVNSLHKFKKTVHWDKSASFGRRQIIVKSSWPFEELSSSLGCIFRLKADSAGAEFARWQHRFHQQRSLLQYSSRFFPSLLRYLLFMGSTKTFLSFCCTIQARKVLCNRAS